MTYASDRSRWTCTTATGRLATVGFATAPPRSGRPWSSLARRSLAGHHCRRHYREPVSYLGAPRSEPGDPGTTNAKQLVAEVVNPIAVRYISRFGRGGKRG